MASLPGAPGRSGAVKTPGTAEPICVSSGSQFLTPVLGMQHPQCSTSSSAPSLPWGSHPEQPWATLGCPRVPLPAGNSAGPARLWERQSSALPSRGGKVCSCFCLFPMFIPHLSSPLAAGVECPWSSQGRLRSGSCLSPVPQQAAPASSCFPGPGGRSAMGTLCCCPALGLLAPSQPLGLGLGQAGPSQAMAPPSAPFIPHGPA